MHKPETNTLPPMPAVGGGHMASDRHADHPPEPERPRRFLMSRNGVFLVAFLAIAGFYLLAEHRAHLFGILPWLLLLACPLLHVFMHGGHGGHGGDQGKPKEPDGTPQGHRR